MKELTSLNDLPEEISQEFSQLCYFAYKGICSKKIVFSSKDLHDMGIIRDINGLGLLLVAPTTSIHGIKKSYNFLHMTLQEFCAAWYLSKLSVNEQTEHFSFFLYSTLASTKLDSINSNVVWRFYSGITQLTNINIEKSLSPQESSLVYKKLLKFIELLCEAGNNSLCQTVGNYFNGDLDLSYDHLHSDYNIHSLQYFLKHFQGNVEFITFGSSYKKDDINHKMFDVIVNSLSLSSMNNLSFRILLSDISTKSFFTLAKLLKAHQHLIVELYFESFYKEYFSFLPQMVCSNEVLKVLCIELDYIHYYCYYWLYNDNEFGCVGADWLDNCKSLHLQHLGLSHCMLNSTGIEKIEKMLSLNSSIVYVDLSYNDIGDDRLERLTCHLKHNCTLQSLDLRGNEITPIGALCLREIVNNLQCIKLSNNPLGHVGIYLILEAITESMEHIDLRGRDASYSYKAFAGILDKVKSINFTLPDDDHEDDKVFYESLANAKILEELKINGVTKLNHQKFLNAITQNNIKTLKIKYDTFTEEFGVHLAEFITINKSLSALLIVCSEYLLPEGLLLIADSLTKNNSIKQLDISYYQSICAECVLEFLDKLKQADNLKWLALRLTGIYGFIPYINVYKNVDMLVQQINQSRSTRGLDPLKCSFDGF